MRYDFSPLYRSTIGFDRLFDMFDHDLDAAPGWPPYDIEKLGEDSYRISVVAAGLEADEIELVQQENELVVTGRRKTAEDGAQYLHRGIASRPFRQTFSLAEHVKVADANLQNGVLTISLRREVPEALKPRRIEIASAGDPQTIVQDNSNSPDQIARRDKAA
jgi:molecular chaperone IbpA